MRRGPGLWAAILAFGLLVVMTAGSLKVMRGRGTPQDTGEAVRSHKESIDAVSIMGSRRFEAGEDDFREVNAVALMGQSTVDLRNVRLSGERAKIDAVAIMGHVVIIVPPDWEVVSGTVVAAGSISNQARKSVVENPKRVAIDGFVLMGRLDVQR